MPHPSIRKYVPGVGAAALPLSLLLTYSGAALNAANPLLDQFALQNAALASAYVPRRDNVVMVVHSVAYSLSGLAAGSAGSYSVGLYKNGVLIPSSIGTVVYNSAAPFVTIDCRDQFGNGIPFMQTDLLQLGLVGVPTTGTLTGIKASVGIGVYGVAA